MHNRLARFKMLIVQNYKSEKLFQKGSANSPKILLYMEGEIIGATPPFGKEIRGGSLKQIIAQLKKGVNHDCNYYRAE